MNNPIKIIHKFKNNNKRIQYNQYIFIGATLDENIYNILDSIKNKSFYETLDFLNKNKIKILEEFYGDNWYIYFFNKYHLKLQKDTIMKNTVRKNNLISKYSKEWFNKHFEIYLDKKKDYSFASNYYDYLVERNKIKTKVKKIEMDFTTYQTGGADDENIDELIEEQEEEQEVINTTEDLDDEAVEDIDLDELTKLYTMENVETDKNITETSKLISEAINDKKWVKDIKNTEAQFNEKIDNLNYDSKLEDIYEKIYIREQFILMDDNITQIRNKLSVSIGLSDKFGDIKLLPEYMYFWIEYNYKDTIDRVMLGQKWIRRNELLKIDIKPNENLLVYENLRNNLVYLKDSFGTKIRREDNEGIVLRDYEEYMDNNEIYMTDILNDLGLNYNSDSEKKRNLFEVYVNIYYPFISYGRYEEIIDLLNNNNETEKIKNENIYNTLVNDLKMETEIFNIIEETKLNKDKYKKMFENNYILQTTIHINLYNTKNKTGTISDEKFDLYKIFDNFIVNEEYPFIQFQTPDSKITYKYYNKSTVIENKTTLSKWFETAPYGISFKIKIKEDKYISISLSETGRLDYKITWFEEEKTTLEDIKESYVYVNNLLLKINNENKKIKIIIPTEDKFKYAFINTIFKFNLPDKFKINHNDLSDLSRFFYTYIALVIEPKKRIGSTITTEGKYGTYLRYKRVSNYDNKIRMHLRILYLIRNFDITDRDLLDEISKQFNITKEEALFELEEVQQKFSKLLKKSSKTKLKKLPRSKLPGLGIDIIGKTPDTYKVRISGGRSKEQIIELESFIHVLLYLYYEIYLNKNPKYQKIKEKLLKLNKIAKRKHKVREIVDYVDERIKVSDITSLDKKRLGFRPDEGMNHWTRSCQNSGENDKRRPLIFSNEDINKLIKRGYKLNPKTNFYEKNVIITEKGKKKEISVRAIKLLSDDGKINYFTCDPEENKKHMFIGFLSKSNNPNELCMPCCFKKDHLTGNNKAKRNYFMKCIGNKESDINVEKNKLLNIKDKIYILKETNKFQEGKFIFLINDLNNFFNIIWNNDYKIKDRFLIESNSGYYFKFTVKDNYYFYLSTLSVIFDKTLDEIKELCINIIENDKNDTIFSYLNNGDIRTLFQTRENYINHIKTNNYLEYDIVGELLSLPNVLTPNGFFPFILEKKTKIIKKELEKDMYIDNFYIKCLNNENNYFENNNFDNNKQDIVILIKDGKYYFPIFRVKKQKKDKIFSIYKKYNFNDNETKNIINELILYYNKSCDTNNLQSITTINNIYAKNVINKLEENNIIIKNQLINDRNKVLYLHIENNLILPVSPSGSSYKYPLINIKDYKKFNSLDETIKNLSYIEKKIKMNYIPDIIYYNKFENKGNETYYNVVSILLKNKTIIQIKEEKITSKQFKKYGLNYEFIILDEIVNKHILDKSNPTDDLDLRVRQNLYRNEAYNLFRLELSYFLNNNNDIKNNIIDIVRNKNINIKNKREELYNIIISYINEKTKLKISSKKESIADIIETLPNLEDYNISNIREYCIIHKNKDTCMKNKHCNFINNKCVFQLYKEDLFIYINRIIEEMILDKVKFKELIQEDSYYVSDIVDYSLYSNRPDQKIIKITNFNVKKILSELFGSDKIPTLGRKKKEIILKEENVELIRIGKQLIQEVKNNDNSVIRAFVNSLYWLNNPLYDIQSRNLGYISELQNNITYLIKANMIDYIINNIYNKEFSKDIENYINIDDIKQTNFFLSAINKLRKKSANTDGILELIVLSYMFKYPIIVYDNFNTIKYIFSNGLIKINDKTIEKYTKLSNTLYIKFDFEGTNIIPSKIYSIYYL
jgi:hypothetical protein